MLVLAIDTETTGLLPNEAAYELWPHIVQFSFVLFDTATSELTEHDYILRVPGDILTTYIHGITKEMSDRGIDFEETYDAFHAALEACDIVVGHNIEFDLKMIQAECVRRKKPFTMPSVRYCTMRENKERVGLLNPSGYLKYPKLVELYEHLFPEPAANCHNALSDAYMCLRCFLVTVVKKDSDMIRVRIHR